MDGSHGVVDELPPQKVKLRRVLLHQPAQRKTHLIHYNCVPRSRCLEEEVTEVAARHAEYTYKLDTTMHIHA